MPTGRKAAIQPNVTESEKMILNVNNNKLLKKYFNHEAGETHREKHLKAFPSCSSCPSWLKKEPSGKTHELI